MGLDCLRGLTCGENAHGVALGCGGRRATPGLGCGVERAAVRLGGSAPYERTCVADEQELFIYRLCNSVPSIDAISNNKLPYFSTAGWIHLVVVGSDVEGKFSAFLNYQVYLVLYPLN